MSRDVHCYSHKRLKVWAWGAKLPKRFEKLKVVSGKKNHKNCKLCM